MTNEPTPTSQPVTPDTAVVSNMPSSINYAGFWKRTAAYLVDYMLGASLISVTGRLIAALIGLLGFAKNMEAHPFSIHLCAESIWWVGLVLYFVWPESSAWQATIGKKLFGLKVTDQNGQRISFWRSLGRNLGMFVSAFTFCIGYLMCIWTKKKQCLHDKMAGCLVVDTPPDKKQGCAVAVAISIMGLYVLVAILLPYVFQGALVNRVNHALEWMDSVEQSQKTYYAQHASYATEWKLLNFEACKQVAGNVCEVNGVQFELENNAISAYPKNHAFVFRTEYGSDGIECESSVTGLDICEELAKAAEEE